MAVTIKYIIGKQTRLQPFLFIRSAEVGWGVVKKESPTPCSFIQIPNDWFPDIFQRGIINSAVSFVGGATFSFSPSPSLSKSVGWRSGGILIAFTVSTFYGLIKFTVAPHQGAHSFIEEGKYYLFMRLCSTVVLPLLSTSSQHTRHLMVDWSGWIIIINLRFIIIINSVYFGSVKTTMKIKELGEICFMKLKLYLPSLHLLPRTHLKGPTKLELG